MTAMRAQSARFPADQSGFTLLELLVALSLVGLLSVLMLGGLRFGVRAWEKGSVSAEQSTTLTIAQRFVRRQVAEALPLVDPGNTRDRNILFMGGRTALRMVTGRLADAYRGGPFLVEFRLAREGAEQQLVVAWRELAPDLSDIDQRTPMSEARLIDKVRDVEFAYFGPREGGDTNQWQDGWTGRGTLPLLVRLRLDPAPESGRHWPELVAATRISGVGVR